MKDILFNRLHSVYFFLLFFFPALLFLAFNKHHDDDYKSYHSVIWADGAGYYVYLPHWFIYGDKIENYPDSVREKTGNGFYIDAEKKIVVTKYTCGTALLQAPFFLLAHMVTGLLGYDSNGFSKPYHWAIFVAAAFYCSLGMFFLGRLLKKYFSPRISFVTVFTLLLATNLYYYAVDNGGMSHVYSFFLVSFFIYAYDFYHEEKNWPWLVLVSIIGSLIILTRPVNVFVLLAVILYKAESFSALFRGKNFWKLASSIVILLMLFTPQLIYWYRISAQWIYYSYGNESFTFWNKPQLIKLWFSTNNGLFTYAPVLVLSLIGSIKMFFDKVENRFLFPVIFIITSYVFASWHSWHLGCAYGARGFVEYLPLFAFPIAYLLMSTKRAVLKYILTGFIIACISLNFDIIYYYSSCFTSGDWNWKSYLDLLKN